MVKPLTEEEKDAQVAWVNQRIAAGSMTPEQGTLWLEGIGRTLSGDKTITPEQQAELEKKEQERAAALEKERARRQKEIDAAGPQRDPMKGLGIPGPHVPGGAPVGGGSAPMPPAPPGIVLPPDMPPPPAGLWPGVRYEDYESRRNAARAGLPAPGPADPFANIRAPNPNVGDPIPQQLGDQGMSGILQQGAGLQATADMGAFPPIVQPPGSYGPASPIDAGYSFSARPGKYPNEVIDEINQPALDRNAPYNPLPGNQQPSGQPGPANPFAGLGDAFGGPGNDQLASQLLSGQFGDRPRGGGGPPGLPFPVNPPGGPGWAPGQIPAPNAPGGIPRTPRPRPGGGMSISAVPEGEEARTPRPRPPQSWDPAGPSSIPDTPYGPGGVQPYGDVGGPRVPQASPYEIARAAAREALDTKEQERQADTMRGVGSVSGARGGDLNLAPGAGATGGPPGSYGALPDLDPSDPYSDRIDPYTDDDDDDDQASGGMANDVAAAAALGDTASTYSGGGEGTGGYGRKPGFPEPEAAIALGPYILPEGSRGALAHYDPKRHQHERIIYEDDPDYAASPLRSYLDRGGAYSRDWGADPIVDDYLQGTAETRGFGALTGGKDAPVHLRGRNTGRIVGAVGGFLAPPGLLASAAGGVIGYKVGGKLGGWFGDRDKGAFTRFTNPGRVGRARDERGRLLDYTVDANGMYHYDNPSLNVVGARRPVYTSIDQELEEGAPPPSVSPILVVDHVAERQAQQDAAIRDAQIRQDEDDRRNESMASSARMSSPGGIWGGGSGLGFGGGRGYGGAAIGLGTGGAINPNR